MNAQIRLDERSALDLEIDRLFLCMSSAEDPKIQADYGRRFTAAVNARNAQRSAQDIERIERERGLR